MRARFAAMVAAAAAAGTLQCAGAAPPAPARHLVLICIDTLRADHVGAYGYRRATTPTLDALARGGALAPTAYAHSNWTVPATASLLTSLYPAEHGAGIEGAMRLLGEGTPVREIRAEVETLAARLKKLGFRTGLFSANPYLYGRFQDGFDTATAERRGAGALTLAARQWLGGTGTERFFLYLQYMDLHQPLEPPLPYFDLFPADEPGPRSHEHTGWSFGGIRRPEELSDPAFARYRAHRTALYDGALRYVDAQIGELQRWLQAAGHAGETLIVVTSDHGEEFWDHAVVQHALGGDPRGLWGVGHGHTMFDELLRVPLVFHGPGVRAGRRLPCTARHVDVVPTVLELLGLPPARGLRGRSLAGWLTGSPRGDDCGTEPVVAHSPAYGPDASAVVWKSWKLISRADGVELLYDLRRDPGERTNLRDTHASRAQELRRLAEAQLAGAAGRPASAPAEPSLEAQRDLRALGYLR
jgi:arylsulfatase A-like enzyme